MLLIYRKVFLGDQTMADAIKIEDYTTKYIRDVGEY